MNNLKSYNEFINESYEDTLNAIAHKLAFNRHIVNYLKGNTNQNKSWREMVTTYIPNSLMKYADHITKNNVKRFNPKIGNAVADALKLTNDEKDKSVSTSDVLKIQDISNTLDKVVDVVKDFGKRIEVIEDETGIADEREKEAKKAAKKVEKAEKEGRVEKSVKLDIEDIKTTGEDNK